MSKRYNCDTICRKARKHECNKKTVAKPLIFCKKYINEEMMQNECQILSKAMRTSKQNRRYRLHQKLAKAGVRYNPNVKTIYVPWDFETENKDLKELQKDFNYQIQLEI